MLGALRCRVDMEKGALEQVIDPRRLCVIVGERFISVPALFLYKTFPFPSTINIIAGFVDSAWENIFSDFLKDSYSTQSSLIVYIYISRYILSQRRKRGQ